ncbi:MAG: hypothetical protein ABFD07_18785 [Methanobacterium sp.]
MTTINEFEVIPIPFVTYPVAKFDGYKLYGSPVLRRQFLTAMGDTPKTKPIINVINNLVNNKIVIPCMVKKSIFDYIKYKTINPNQKFAETIPILGFYDSRSKKVYVVTNNNRVFFESDSKALLAKYTIHELMHKVAEEDKNFLANYKDELEKFYSDMFTEMFKLKKKVDVMPVVTFIYNMEMTNYYTTDKLKLYYNLLNSTFKSETGLKRSEYEKMLNDYILAVKLLITGAGGFKNASRHFGHVLNPIYKAYKTAFGINLRYLVIQELLIVSEVICIYSETKTNSKIYSSIKNLV